MDAHYEETFPKGRKSKETSVGNIKNGHENVVGNFSKMVMKLWNEGDKEPCDNQIYLSVLQKWNKFELEMKIKYKWLLYSK